MTLCAKMKLSREVIRESYYNWSLASVCLFQNYSAVYGPIGTKLGREVGGGST